MFYKISLNEVLHNMSIWEKIRSFGEISKRLFIKTGVLPFLIILALVIFTLLSDHFLTLRNVLNVSRQSTYLIIVAMGQMLALVTGGFDLSVGTVIALTSVVSAMAMSFFHTLMPEQTALVISLGISAGLLAGISIGSINGIGIAFFGVNPFMMTLGMSSVGFGIALFLTGGTPVYGMPESFSDIFGFGRFLTVPAPVYLTGVLIVGIYFLLNWTKHGRYFYAVGSNIKASVLSGISTRANLFLAYLLCSGIATISGLLLTARLETGEANIGSAMPLESIAACVIGGVSLKGGVGRLENVVLGGLFIGLVQNGMNLAKIESYLQTVVIGLLLIFAVVADQVRQQMIVNLQE